MKKILLSLLVSLAMFVKSERPKFRGDYRYEKAFGAFYKLHTDAVNWHQARVRCEAEGAELIIPESLDEADVMPVLVSSMPTKHDGVFIGVHDLYSERTFVTMRGYAIQDTILDLLWELKEPLHSGGRCVAMRRNGHTYVKPCFQPLPFVCKVVAKQISYNKECDTFDPNWKLGPNDTCYITHEEKQTWHDAYSTCLGAGGHLAILDSRGEVEYVQDLFKQVDQNKAPDFAFLGYSDLFQRYHYRTVHGQPIPEGSVHWDLKCPQKNGNQVLRCGGFRRSGLLATGDCDRPSMFFCEKSAKANLRSVLKSNQHNKGHHHKLKTN